MSVRVQQKGQSSQAAATKTQLDSHTAWQAKLDASIACLQLLLTPTQANSKAWRPVQPGQSSTNASTSSIGNLDSILASAPSTSQTRLDNIPLFAPNPASIQVHKRSAARQSRDSNRASGAVNNALLPPGSSQSADIYRAVCQIPLGKQVDNTDFAWRDLQDAFRRFLTTPECRPLWDHMVDDSEVIEELDAATRICRTVFRLGWPASQRDAITISRTIRDGQSLMDVSTSLPRSPDAPAYLRPAPPYVRSHVNLFAWCLQKTADSSSLRVSLFWSWDLKGAWLGMPTGGLGAQLPNIVSSLVSHVDKDASRVPYLASFGRNVEVTRRKYDPTRDMLSVEYQVICEADQRATGEEDETMTWTLPAAEGWDVHVEVRSLSGSMSNRSSETWRAAANRQRSEGESKSGIVNLHLQHGVDDTQAEIEQGIRGTVTIQRIAASQEVRLRVNGRPFTIEEVVLADEKAMDPADSVLSVDKGSIAPLIDDGASVSGISLRSDASSHSRAPTAGGVEEMIKRTDTPGSINERMAASGTVATQAALSNGKGPAPFDRSNALAGLIRRNYIYFTSLLQEPEAKWKQQSDARGVTITQLDSIDPTLVVYRAEATFVGVSVWDIFATLGNAGAKSAWDRGAEETKLVEDLGDASKLWWTKTRAAWPVSPRDSVTVETSYKSPSSIHVFSFSTDDRGLFPSLPKVELGSIRTQVDLRGWSIESLNPTTVHITLIEQSDPKGWTSKSAATPAAMTAAVAGVGDFAIKQGGPPIVTRLLGGKTKTVRYEHDKGAMRMEYELSTSAAGDAEENTHVECEIRCDMETWCQGLDLVVDPPPINVSCLRRHKLSQGGSGLWLTIEHVAASLEDDLARVTVRKAGPGKEKGVVLVNGARIKVDVDELKEDEVALLKDKKRGKPKRIPLDLINSSPKMASSKRNVGGATSLSGALLEGITHSPGSAPVSRTGTPALPLGSHEALSQAVSETNDVFSDERPRQPMTCALDVLFLLRRIHAERGPDPAGNPAGWSLLTQRNGLYVRRRMMQSISSTIHVQRGDKVVEGLTAEDILSAVSSMSCRRLWDDKVESSMLLEAFGNGATTGFFTTKASFPFRGRAFHLASLTARSGPSSMSFGSSAATPTVFFHASASFPDRNSSFSPYKLNPSNLPLGKVLIDGWILETLDPYSSTLNYQIPSTRCTHVVAVDYAGSLPIAVNTMWNSTLPRSILAVEEYVRSKGTLPNIRSPPCCVEVLGDGRDEDRNLIWNMEDDKSKRSCTLLSAVFDPVEKLYSVMVRIESKTDLLRQQSERASLAIPFPRRVAASNASTTKAAAITANEGADLPATASSSDVAKDKDEEGSMSRATSVNSIKSIATKSRPSLSRIVSKKPTDIVLMDVEVELRHYERGYEVVTSSELDVEPKEDGGKPDALSLKAAPGTCQALPLVVACFDLPPSAVLAATLDPAARPRKHLLRLTLPTASLFEEHRDDVLSGPDPEEAPEWFHDLRKRGASVRLVIRPVQRRDTQATDSTQPPESQSATPNSEIDSQQVPVYFRDEKIQVTHVNQTSAMLQRESEKVEGHARLKRVAPSLALKAEAEENKQENILDDRLPSLLQRPIAVVKEMVRNKDDEGKESRRGSLAVLEPKESLSTATSSTEIPDPSTPIGKMSSDSSNQANGQPSSLLPAASTPIMGILNSYPLSRLGASTAVTTAVANGGVFSKATTTPAKDRLQSGSNRDHTHSNGRDASVESKSTSFAARDGKEGANVESDAAKKALDGGMPGNLAATTEEIRKRLSDVRFSLSTLILVAIIAFLFGSLVRSLLEPADFILISSASRGIQGGDNAHAIQDAARDEIKRMLYEGGSKAGGLGATSPNVVKRELKRFVELHLFGGRWDLLVAAARR